MPRPTTRPMRSVLVWTTTEVRARVQQLAAREQCSMAAVGRRALEEYLDRTLPLGETTMLTAKPTREELRWRMISDLLDWDSSRSKAKLERLSDEELRALWYGHRDAERRRVEAEEEQAHREAAEPEAGGA